MKKLTNKSPSTLLLTVMLLFSTSACTTEPKYAGGASRMRQLAGLPSHYSAESIEGWVVDAKTKAPIEGVIVVALWKLYETWDNGSKAFSEHIEVMETVTDTEGRYYFPAWGPLERPGEFYIRHGVRLYVFKEDYRYKSLKNEFRGRKDDRYQAVHRSEWDSKTVELAKFEGSLEEYAKHLDNLDISLRKLRKDDCKWKKTPRIYITFNKYNAIFQKEKIHEELHTLERLFEATECGNKEEFLKELGL